MKELEVKPRLLLYWRRPVNLAHGSDKESPPPAPSSLDTCGDFCRPCPTGRISSLQQTQCTLRDYISHLAWKRFGDHLWGGAGGGGGGVIYISISCKCCQALLKSGQSQTCDGCLWDGATELVSGGDSGDDALSQAGGHTGQCWSRMCISHVSGLWK